MRCMIGENASQQTLGNSIVKCPGMTLVTRNADHFNRREGLEIEKW